VQSATLRDVRTGLDEVQAGRSPARARRGEGSLLRDGPYANGCVEPVSCEFEPSLRRQARILEIGYQRPATASSRFEIVDIPPDTIKEIASGTTISNCNGCQRRFAQMVGANWAAWGSAEGEQPNPEHQCLHGGCGIRYDEVRPERRHSRQHRRILATGARLFAAQLFVARTLTADALRSEQDLQALSRRYNSS
jgi:hypothetical protein